MNSQALQAWNQTHPVGTTVVVKMALASSLTTSTRSTAYIVNGTPVVMVSGMSTPVPLAEIEVAKVLKFPLQLTTAFYDEEHLKAIQDAVGAINSENVDLHIEKVDKETDGSGWTTISASSANRVFHLGARVGKWLVEEKGGLVS